MPWEDHARCLEHDPDIFFATRARAERRAKSICSRCPVKADCLAFALQSKVEFGIWGGLNGNERRALLRRTAGAPDWRRQLAAATA
ncbi:MAG TPA: WhiB family transcriptional regulator [Actinomycetota bacterium]|nr:WhiB family transcriptional regulator [Actinomycetota bacterium]